MNVLIYLKKNIISHGMSTLDKFSPFPEFTMTISCCTAKRRKLSASKGCVYGSIGIVAQSVQSINFTTYVQKLPQFLNKPQEFKLN